MPHVADSGSNALWRWVSERVAAYPRRIWVASVLLLLPLFWLGYTTTYGYDITAELPRNASSRAGLDTIKRHFTAGELGPLAVMLQADIDWRKPEGRALLAKLSRELEELPNVAEVRSFTQPLGVPPKTPAKAGDSPLSWSQKLAGFTHVLLDLAAQERYLAQLPQGNVARFDVVFHTEPFSAHSIQTMQTIRRFLEDLPSAERGPVPAYVTHMYGVTALARDIEWVHENDRLLINGLTLVGILFILVLIVRRPVLAIYLLLTVLFSYYATIGMTELLSIGWLDPVLGEIDWKVPFFLFTILVAVGEDYNIFLMARILEEEKTHGLQEGTKRALAFTGGTISSCGLIMAGTFATMTLCTLPTLVQLGLALAFGVLLDTFVVRPILVPTFLLMTYRKPRPRSAADPCRSVAA
jgi:RND superfamily putative drug exporter